MTDPTAAATSWEYEGILFASSTEELKSKHQLAEHEQQQPPFDFDMQDASTADDVIPPESEHLWATVPASAAYHHLQHPYTTVLLPHHHHASTSRSSSPFSGSGSSSSLPLAENEPIWLENEELHSESESSAASLHHHSSEATTPQHSQSPTHHLSSATSPLPIVQHMQMMPTIAELPRPAASKAQHRHHQVGEDLPELQLPQQAVGIGMLLPQHSMSSLDSEGALMTSRTSPASHLQQDTPMERTDRNPVRARRRTRYTTAAAASVAARASIAMPVGNPSLAWHSSHESRSMDITSNHSAHSSEQEDNSLEHASEEFDPEDQDYNEEDQIRSGKAQSTKRKRAASSEKQACAASLADSLDFDEDSPAMKGLDKRERNKLSASMYRKRRKVYLDSLEGKVGELDTTIAKQKELLERQAHENKVLKEQLSFLKKMVANFKGLAGEDTQPSNVHEGARRGVASSSGFMMLMMMIVACICFFSPMATTHNEVSSASPMGRKLLSIEDDSYSYEIYQTDFAVYSEPNDMLATQKARGAAAARTSLESISEMFAELASYTEMFRVNSTASVSTFEPLVAQIFAAESTNQAAAPQRGAPVAV